jgi:hypothetical protein
MTLNTGGRTIIPETIPDWMNKVDRRIEEIDRMLARARNPTVVSTIPSGAPQNGDEIYFQTQAMADLGVMWRFRFRDVNPNGTANTSTKKWEYVGGSQLYVVRNTDFQTVSDGTTLHDPADADVDVLIPLRGDYQLEYGAAADAASPNGSGQLYQTPVNMTDAPTTGIGLSVMWRSDNWQSDATKSKVVDIPANKNIRTRYSTINGAGRVSGRWLSVLPIRVGP